MTKIALSTTLTLMAAAFGLSLLGGVADFDAGRRLLHRQAVPSAEQHQAVGRIAKLMRT